MLNKKISYKEMCDKIGIGRIQKGMNFRVRNNTSVILTSVRHNSPYNDDVNENADITIYEGHDVVRSKSNPNPKLVDQPIKTERGTLTENGKFVQAVENYKKGNPPEEVMVFEKLETGVWIDRGFFELVDYEY